MNFENGELFRGKYRILSSRYQSWDYSSHGFYFVTICTKDRQEFFGEIRNGIMGLNEMGCMAARFWQDIPNNFENAVLDEWVVMPNHMHGLLFLRGEIGDGVETRRGASLPPAHDPPTATTTRKFGPLQKQSLSSIINHYKGDVTKWCRKNGFPDFSWQARFHDRIVRDEEDLNRIREYIRNNPRMWKRDRNNPESDLFKTK